jgi:mannosyl-oligosaccharide alpha-1,2-mannosidase
MFTVDGVTHYFNGSLTFIADYNIAKKEIAYVGSHLACFIGGNIAMAGRLYKRDDWTQIGLEVTESCYETYKASVTGVGPYSIGWFDQKGDSKGWSKVPTGQREFANEHGFFNFVTFNLLSPEIVESLYYAHRITGNPMFRDMAWDAFKAMQKYGDAEIALAGIQNVNDLNSNLYDQTETYFYSATLKYLYLIFSEANDISLDEYVFTTEGHIFKR